MTAAAATSRDRGSVDRQADFDAFVVARSPALLRTAYLLTREHALAEDLLQTALTGAWFAWDRIDGDPEPYVRRILVNTYASWWRRKWNGEHATEVLPEGSRDDFAADSSTSHDLWEALGRLTRRQRAVVVLRYFEDLTEVEAAKALGCLGRHREVPDQQGDGPAPARPGPHRRGGVLMSNALRDVLEQARARRRRRGHRRPPRAGPRPGDHREAAPPGRGFGAGRRRGRRPGRRADRVHRRPARPAPRPRRSDPGVHSPDRGRRGQRRERFSAYFDVPTTDLRFVYSCPEGEGSVAIAVEGHDLVKAAPGDVTRRSSTARVPGWCSTNAPGSRPGTWWSSTMPARGRGQHGDRHGQRRHPPARGRPQTDRPAEAQGGRRWRSPRPGRSPRTTPGSSARSRPPIRARGPSPSTWARTCCDGRRGVRRPVHRHRAGRRPDQLDGPVQLDPESNFDGTAVPRAGGRFTIRLDQEPEPDGVIGFVLYTRTN